MTYDYDTDNLWVRLDKLADEQRALNSNIKLAIEAARRDDRSWEWIAETLRLLSEDAAKALYQQITNQAVGID